MPQPLLLAPSILSADFARLAEDVAMLEKAGADWLHLDVMDGHFVPNISFGPDMVRTIRNLTTLPLDVHLMIAPADPYLAAFAAAGADGITIHAEAGPHAHRSLQTIRALGKRAGLALNPGTPAVAAEPLLESVDLLLCMSVNPGFGGQSFIPEALDKLERLCALIGGRPIRLEVDGGVTPANAAAVARAGADVLVAGSAAFKGGRGALAGNLAALRRAAGEARGEWA